MADDQVALTPANTAIDTKSHVGFLGRAANLATSQVAAVTAFLGAIAAAYYSFQTLQKNLGLSPRLCAAVVVTLLALLFFSHTLSIALERRRISRLPEVSVSVEPGYFQLAARDDEATFQRADGKHEEVLRWLRRPPARVLYLTGSSGTGKSSLLAAWVLPRLKRDGVNVIRLRGYQDPAKALENELKRTGEIWKRNPPETSDLNLLFEQARQRLHPTQILVVFDQFEEFLILHEEKQRKRFVEFLNMRAGVDETGPSILLVFRAEYDGFIQEMGLPVPIPGRNLQKVSAFTERAAQKFLIDSKLHFQPEMLASVLREAAGVEETKGLIRPVTLNLCGLVLLRFSRRPPREFRPGRMIRGFVSESVFLRGIRDVTPVLLPRLVSPQITKRPQSLRELAGGTGLTTEQVRGAMFALADPDRAIVHPIDEDYTVWEISHDFLVPMIDSTLAQRRISFWHRIRPWAPLAYAAALLLALLVAPRLAPDPIHELHGLGWTIDPVYGKALRGASVAYREANIAHIFVFSSSMSNSMPSAESARWLGRVREPFAVELYVDSFDSAHFAGWSQIANLRWLRIKATRKGSDASALKELTNIKLTRLELFNFAVADADLKLLPRSLTFLSIPFDGEITGEGFKDLPRSLTWLDLSQDSNIAGVWLKDMPTSLTQLEIYGANQVSAEDVRALPSTTKVER